MRKRYFLQGTVLAFGIFILLLLPDAATILNCPEGEAWSPLNSATYRLNDDYYYAGVVMEVLEGDIPPASASAEVPQPTMELFRLSSAVLAAWPGVFFDDPRIVFTLSWTSMGALFVLGIFCLARSFGLGCMGATAVSLAVLFQFHFVSYALCAPNYHWSALLQLLNTIRETWMTMPRSFEECPTQLRFFIPSAANVIAIIFVSLLVAAQRARKRSWLLAISLVLVGLAVAYSYPFVAAGCFALFFFLFCLSLRCTVGRHISYTFFIAGALLLGILLAGNIFGQYSTALENSLLLRLTVASERIPAASKIYMLLQLAAVHGVFTFCAWKNMSLRQWMLAFSGLWGGYAAAMLLDIGGYGLGRLLLRGVGAVWFVFGLIGLGIWIKNIAIRPISQRVLTFLFLAPLVFFPVYGYAIVLPPRHATDAAYRIPEGEWAAYAWLMQHTQKNDIVLALGERANYLLPVYTKCDLYYGQFGVSFRPYETEVSNFLSAAKYLNLPIDELEKLVAKTVESTYALRARTGSEYAQSFVSESAFIVHGLFYYPYIRQYGDIPIADGQKTNQYFIKKIISQYEKSQINELDFSYIVIDKFYIEKVSIDSTVWEIVFQNENMRIYRKKQI